MAVKEVLAGDSVHSLLSILDVITVSPLGCPASPGLPAGPSAPRPVIHSEGLVWHGRDPQEVRGACRSTFVPVFKKSWAFPYSFDCLLSDYFLD